ncbi:RluA family pseudouridine synthase [Chlamydia sp. 17-3921]|uniref:RluA family pseudouridine synthase n=1 Tax=Chlamydia sp. 17-3921 TaxID=2675798 RepID=UPI00191921AF|nr:RluA family pseudouridine synthase [Chlamydia sp. 17-3921]
MCEFTWYAETNARLSSFLRSRLPNYSKQTVLNSIRYQHCRINGKIERFESYKVQSGDCITFSIIQDQQPPTLLWEEDLCCIYDKPPYLTTEETTLTLGWKMVHRLDRDTTGCLLFAKTHSAAQQLMEMFKKHKIRKQYLALVFGCPKKESGTITTFTAPRHKRCGAILFGITSQSEGKLTITKWSILQRYKHYTLILCEPITGRTHQIRLHMQHLGFPIVGDIDYGSKQQPAKIFRPLLHAHSLEFVSPFSKQTVHATASSTGDPRICAAHLLKD